MLLGLLALLLLERLLLVLGQPDLLQDLDPAELKHMGLAVRGLPGGDGLGQRLHAWLASPANIHHGGFPVVSISFWLMSKVLGTSLTVLRLIPIGATVLAAALVALWLHRRSGPTAALVALALLAGAPLLFLKWSCVARGGHTEAIVFVPLLLVALEAGLRGEGLRPWLLAGLAGGFAVYFTYLALPAVVLLSLGALIERWRTGGLPKRAGMLALGAAIGFLPWLLGLVVLDLPYLEATIHQSGNPDEAAEVFSRGLVGTVQAAVTHLPHNLWPWTSVTSGSAAYQAEVGDMLDFVPSSWEWVVRGVVLAAGLLGLIAAFARRSPLVVALAVLPAAHYLFVVRMANQLAWPDVAHRYFVLVFPAVVASMAFGAAWLGDGEGRLRKVAGIAVLALLGALTVNGVVLHAGWMRAPQLSALSDWDAAVFQQAGVGRIRLHEGAAMQELIEQHQGEWEADARQGLRLVYPPLADHYLLFRPELTRPYPNRLLRRPDVSTDHEEGRLALVRAAWDATALRAAGDEAQLLDWVCSWRPDPTWRTASDQVLQEKGTSCPER
jgi:hypothetical protein